ncbi:hypothetical protein MNBD_GAMMA10-1151 [hydrothermal vent metagenome]|uniref:Uncharacterized protein n=1 Tax=hydrothermal vent metagenome TaxID=652676 RepID=A0A3B0XPN4_9ZZZZ
MNSDNTNHDTGNEATLRDRFLAAVRSGQLGTRSGPGVVVTIGEFKRFFQDVNRNYVTSFLPMAAIETGRLQMTYTKYIFRLQRGIYFVHPGVFKEK